MNGVLTSETLDLFARAMAADNPELLKAGWAQPGTATTGIQAYNLEQPSKKLFPVLSPLRNMLPRVGPFGGSAINWKAVTGINTALLTAGVSEGNRAGVVTTTTTDNNVGFKGIGLEDFVTFEARYAGQTFEDIRALAMEDLLSALMIEEERLILAGNGTANVLGTAVAPVGVLTAGGAMTAQASFSSVVALTLEGYRQTTVSAAGVLGTVSRTRGGPVGGSDTINLGSSIISVQSNSITTAGGNLAVTWTTTPVRGAFAYAWYTGPTGQANQRLNAITTTPVFLQLADAGGANQLANAAPMASDRSLDATVFDGIIPQVVKSGSGGYYKDLGNAGFTGDNAGGISEIDVMLQDRYDLYRLGFDRLWVSSQEYRNLKKKIFAPGATPAPIARITVPDGGGPIRMTGGAEVPQYLNPFTGQLMDIVVHPFLPPGTCLGQSDTLPYRLSNVPAVARIATRVDYYAIAWPNTVRKDEYGVYADETCQVYFPAAFGCITGIGNV